MLFSDQYKNSFWCYRNRSRHKTKLALTANINFQRKKLFCKKHGGICWIFLRSVLFFCAKYLILWKGQKGKRKLVRLYLKWKTFWIRIINHLSCIKTCLLFASVGNREYSYVSFTKNSLRYFNQTSEDASQAIIKD